STAPGGSPPSWPPPRRRPPRFRRPASRPSSSASAGSSCPASPERLPAAVGPSRPPGRFLDNPPRVAPLTVMSNARHRRRPAFALGFALALVLPACGGDDDSTVAVD